ncbi:hypothetical protein FRB93_005683 [Tulasnella sp. JGI-2019a]|nr:hypothetical protein FRB93_005683 [Tulasnella sp. JGI-2019a]
MQFSFIVTFLAFCVASISAAPLDRRLTAVSNVKCTSKTALDFHETNVAILAICGGIAGTIEKCQGSPTSTVGAFGGSKFTITPVVAGATLNISKGRWEQGIKAVAAICGADIPFTATFQAGASTGDVNVTLAAA